MLILEPCIVLSGFTVNIDKFILLLHCKCLLNWVCMRVCVRVCACVRICMSMRVCVSSVALPLQGLSELKMRNVKTTPLQSGNLPSIITSSPPGGFPQETRLCSSGLIFTLPLLFGSGAILKTFRPSCALVHVLTE